jgi:hypothetical protein
MKTFILITFFFIINCSFAQQAIVSNGRSSVTINNSLSIELSDSFFKTTEIVAKLNDENGKTIPSKRANIVIQPKKGDAVVYYYKPNYKSEFHLITKNIALLSHLTSGSRVIIGFEPFKNLKYPKFMYGGVISIR